MKQLQVKFITVVLEVIQMEKKKLIDFEKGERCICARSYPFLKKTSTCYRMQTMKSTKNVIPKCDYDYKV